MAERLTKKEYKNWSKVTGYYNKKDAERLTQTDHKLGKLEDIMEKYGIESVEELDKRIYQIQPSTDIDKIDLEAENDYLKQAIKKQNIVTQYISQDRYIWKKVSLKLVKKLRRWEDLSVGEVEATDEEIAHALYQQAKGKG